MNQRCKECTQQDLDTPEEIRRRFNAEDIYCDDDDSDDDASSRYGGASVSTEDVK